MFYAELQVGSSSEFWRTKRNLPSHDVLEWLTIKFLSKRWELYRQLYSFTSQKPRVLNNIALRISILASLLESLNNLQVLIYLCKVGDDLKIEIWKYLQNWL